MKGLDSLAFGWVLLFSIKIDFVMLLVILPFHCLVVSTDLSGRIYGVSIGLVRFSCGCSFFGARKEPKLAPLGIFRVADRALCNFNCRLG